MSKIYKKDILYDLGLEVQTAQKHIIDTIIPRIIIK